jgi:hypothetical protein
MPEQNNPDKSYKILLKEGNLFHHDENDSDGLAVW